MVNLRDFRVTGLRNFLDKVRLLFIAILWASVARAESANTNGSSAIHFLGTGTCSSSNCHGSVNPRQGSNILQNEYVTWQRHDRHAKAYAALKSDDALRMAKLLGISDLSSEPQCLRCHATYAPSASLKGEKYTLEDGVTCESCHGASDSWLKSHSERQATHAKNRENGLRDTVHLQERARLCVECHVGNDQQFVNHRLIGAGHPRLAFDLDTYEALMPRHWNVDQDYVQRKANYSPAQAWLESQLALAEETLDRLQSATRGHVGLMPELSNFHCYSCHHSLSEEQWKTRSYNGKPGELRPNLTQLEVLGSILTSLKAPSAEKWNTELSGLESDFGTEKTAEQLHSLQKLLPTTRTEILSVNLSPANLHKLVNTLASRLSNPDNIHYEDAEQAAMSISSISAQDSSASESYKTQLDSLYRLLRDPNHFDPDTVSRSAKAFVHE